MNMKKIIAGAVASVMAVSTMAIAASAEVQAITFKDETGKATLGDSSKGDNTRITWNVVDVLPEGVKIEDVYGVQLNLDGSHDEASGMGGSFIFSTKSNNWNGVDWANEGKDINFDATNKTLTRLEETPFFTATDISGAEGEYAQIVVDAYWGSGEYTVKSMTFLDKDGKDLTASSDPGTDDPGTDDPGTDDPQTPPNTGVEGVAVVVGLAVLATGALVVAKKRK